jgi:tetratricopeptide (TPR) repeat protein
MWPRNPSWLATALLVGSLLCTRPARLAAAAPDPQAIVTQTSQFLEWGRWKDARQLISAAVQRDPNVAILQAYYAHVLIGFSDVKGALDAARRAVSLDENCALCHLYLGEALGERARHMNKLRALVQLRTIRQELERAYQLNPNLDDVQWGLINFNLQVPPAAGGKIEAALEHANDLMKIDPVDAHIARAAVFLAQGHNESALLEYEQAARQYPGDPRGSFSAGFALFQRGDYAAALPYLQRARDLAPASTLYAAYAAATLVHLRHQNEARQILVSSDAQHPDSRLADYLVAQALRDVGQNFTWARQLLTAYMAVPPEPDQPSADDARRLLQSLG